MPVVATEHPIRDRGLGRTAVLVTIVLLAGGCGGGDDGRDRAAATRILVTADDVPGFTKVRGPSGWPPVYAACAGDPLLPGRDSSDLPFTSFLRDETPVLRKLQVDSQLLTEHLVIYLGKIDAERDLVTEFTLYNMLRKVKRTAKANPPFYARERIHHNVDELRNHWKHCAGIAERILDLRTKLDAGADPHRVCPPNVTADCSWDCDFAEPCLSGMMDDGSDIEGYLAEKYETHNPLERYVSEQSA